MTLKRILFLMATLGAAGALLFAGCDDGGGDDPKVDADQTEETTENDGDVSEEEVDADEPDETEEVEEVDEEDVDGVDDVEDVNDVEDVEDVEDVDDVNDVEEDEVEECCTQAECAAMGENYFCDPTDCECKEDEDPLCSYVGDECDLEDDQAAVWVCVEGTDGTGICLSYCQTEDGEADPCSSGSFCSEETAGEGGFCYPSECEGFFANDCGDGYSCIPYGNGANLCFEAGLGEEGADCATHSDCAQDMVCVGTCTVPDCAPLTEVVTCEAGEQCGGYSYDGEPIDIGTCYGVCDPFAAVDECPNGEWCYPSSDRDATTGNIYGQCVESGNGDVAEGGACDGTTAICEDGMDCVFETCFEFCDPEAEAGSGVCAEGYLCTELFYQGGGSTVWGICQEACTPYVEESGCAEGDWCSPDFYESGVGLCYAEEDTLNDLGEACGETEGYCNTDLLCVGGTCELLCDPEASGSEPGTCGEGNICSGLYITDDNNNQIELAIGVCAEPECVYNPEDPLNPTVPCETAGDFCTPAYLYGLNLDICFPEDDPDYTAAGFPMDEFDSCTASEFGTFCRPNGMCLDMNDGEGVVCREICGGDVDGYGTGDTNHPHCSRSDAVCNGDPYQTTEFGICDI